MFRRFKNLKLIAAISALMAMFAVAPVAHGGLLWTGIDPIIKTRDGQVVNVWVEWPSGMECAITDKIDIDVHTRGELLMESFMPFTCGDGLNWVSTKTDIVEIGVPHQFNITGVMLPATQSFPVQVKVYINDSHKLTCEGMSNQRFGCDTVSLR
ncbi:MAG: hypothetical protein L0177_12130 [Chloroflexi bacterium]|nr:hypothetical protein [Chloroflexota bacterium]